MSGLHDKTLLISIPLMNSEGGPERTTGEGWVLAVAGRNGNKKDKLIYFFSFLNRQQGLLRGILHQELPYLLTSYRNQIRPGDPPSVGLKLQVQLFNVFSNHSVSGKYDILRLPLYTLQLVKIRTSLKYYFCIWVWLLIKLSISNM